MTTCRLHWEPGDQDNKEQHVQSMYIVYKLSFLLAGAEIRFSQSSCICICICIWGLKVHGSDKTTYIVGTEKVPPVLVESK